MISLTRKIDESSRPNTWADESFSPDERMEIEESFRPLGDISSASLLRSTNPNSVASLLGHLKKAAVRHLGYKLIPRIETLAIDFPSILDVHFSYAQVGIFLYRWRETDEEALERAVAAFERQILFGAEAANAFATSHSWQSIPAHAGYRQLRIIEEKRGNTERAVQLCIQAKEQGWADDWDRHIARLEKKAAQR